MKEYRIIFHYKKYISQIIGHTSNTNKLSQKLDKSIINVIFALPSDSIVLFSPCFVSTVWHPWIDVANFGRGRDEKKNLVIKGS